MTLNLKPAVLLATSKWWPASARLALALVQQGCRVDVLCPPGHPLLQVPGLGRCWRYATLDSLASLRTVLGHGHGYRMVLPGDDEVVAQLLALHEQVPVLRGLIEQSIGPVSAHPALMQRHELLATAQSLGIDVPELRRIQGEPDLNLWFREGHGRSVLKRDLSFGGGGVCIVDTLPEAERAWRRLTRAPRWWSTLRQLMMERDPMIWWGRRHPLRREVLVQRFIEGRPANTLMLCWQGRLLGLVSMLAVETRGPTGHATVLRRIHHPGMAEAAQRLCAHLRLSGFHGLDFMLERGSERAWLIELNPRCTQSGHLAWADQPSLAALLGAHLRGAAAPLPVRQPLQGDLVSLFPQVPLGEAEGEHDVPSGQPALVQALLQKPWPQRQWIYRCQLALRPAMPLPRVRHVEPHEIGPEPEAQGARQAQPGNMR